jgi:rhamnulokinase
MNAHYFLAFDLGAESGRAILGQLAGERLRLSEVYRFPNVPVRLPDGLHWDVLRLWSEIKESLRLLANPYHYRDSRTDGILAEAFRLVPRQEIFAQTGIQFMPINSLYQLLAMVIQRSPLLDVAQTFLTMPDLFNYWLTGRQVSEFSIATTTQCYDPRQGDWARLLLERFGIPTHIFPPILPSGTVLSPLLPPLAEEVGLGSVPIIAPACHDTASAVAAVPAEGEDFVYISSGTWSLLGTELPEPIINEQSLAFDFTNEGGVGGTFRFLKNITGLWLVQECRRTWARQGQEFSYDELTPMAAQTAPLQSIVDPDDGEFAKHGDMPARIQAFCQRTGQTVPQSPGEVVRCALESLALKYRWVLERLEKILGRRLEPIHIVGGGAQNWLLCQLTADATGRRVVAGPVEATAIGNIIVQAMAREYVASLAEGRRLVRNSCHLATYEPVSSLGWEAAYGRLASLIGET